MSDEPGAEESKRMQKVAEVLKGAPQEEIGEIAEALAASVVAEMPDPAQAAELFGQAVLRSAMILRRKAA